MTMPSSIALPLAHAWFKADTRLPRRRFSMAKVKQADVDAFVVVAARFAAVRDEPLADEPAENTLDHTQRSYDDYFHVARVGGWPVPVLRKATAQALDAAVRDYLKGHSLTKGEVAVFARGLNRLADWLLVPTEVSDEAIAAYVASTGQVIALDRWKIQHLLFFIILHGMLYLLHVLEEALDREHAPVVAAILDDFAVLMEASAYAFKLTGDFSAEDYENIVRPDMEAHDPHFSGLFSADHKELVTSLRVLKRVPDDFADELARINEAVGLAYEYHAYVCERVIGRAASLANRDETKVGPDSLRGKFLARTRVMAGFRPKGAPAPSPPA
jgi:hypothetical protein